MTCREIDPNKPDDETLALLEILALGERQIAQGEVKPAAEVCKALRDKLRQHQAFLPDTRDSSPSKKTT